MFAIVLVGLIAASSAAPRFSHGPPSYYPASETPHFDHFNHDPFADEIFDTKQFWSQIANQMRQLDTVLAEFYKKFPAVSSTQGYQGNEYIVTIPLSGFEEKEIVVKAREGLLMVQAVHRIDEGQRSYLDIKTLPAIVDVKGSWTFEDDVLKIVFPLKPGTEIENTDTTMAPATEYSREEVGGNEEDSTSESDADVGVRNDLERNRDIITNEIPRNTVEATTYAIDVKDEVEFVPVPY